MQNIKIQTYLISLSGKDDGSTHDASHKIHQKFVSCTQEHTNKVYTITGDEKPGQLPVVADAIVCPEKLQTPIGTYMADCNPIAIVGTSCYALIHGSRKTLKNNIIHATMQEIKKYEKHISTMEVYIGPSIRIDTYEVGSEFINYFDKKYLISFGEKYKLDMIGYIIDQFNGFGILEENITVHTDSTYINTAKRYSYRQGDKGLRNFMGISKQ